MSEDFLTLARMMDAFAGAATAQDKWTLAQDLAHDRGLCAVNVGSIRAATLELTYMRSAMRGAWLEEYVSQSYVEVDPYVQMVPQGIGARSFIVRQERPDDPKKRTLFGRLDDEGYRLCFGQPFDSDIAGERRMVTLFSDETAPRDWGPERQAELRCLALVFNAHLFDAVGRRAGSMIDRPLLTGRERDVLLLLASGMQNKRIAEALGLAEVTVRMHFAAARSKLGARTREQALAIAMRDGHIAF